MKNEMSKKIKFGTPIFWKCFDFVEPETSKLYRIGNTYELKKWENAKLK